MTTAAIAQILLKVIPSIWAFFSGRKRKLEDYIEYVTEQIQAVEALDDLNDRQKRDRVLSNVKKAYPKLSERHARTTNEIILSRLHEKAEDDPEDAKEARTLVLNGTTFHFHIGCDSE